MSFKFPKALRLRTRRDFKRMAKNCFRHDGHFLSIDEKKNNCSCLRLGITVTRRFGDAHLRNRFKRILREAFRLSCAELRQAIDINVRPKACALRASLEEIQNELKKFLS